MINLMAVFRIKQEGGGILISTISHTEDRRPLKRAFSQNLTGGIVKASDIFRKMVINSADNTHIVSFQSIVKPYLNG